MAPDYRDYINPHPRYSAKAQLEAFSAAPGMPYIEDRTGKVFERKLLRSLRPRSIVRVSRPFLLAPSRGRSQTRRDRWLERRRQITKKKAKFLWIGDPKLNGEGLAMLAYEEIASSGRGRAKQGASGRPNKIQDPEIRAKCEAMWHDRRSKNRVEAAKAISVVAGKRITTGWCYSNFGKPGHES